MAKTYEQIQRQIAALQAEAEKLRRKEIGDVIARIREAIAFYGITAADLGLAAGGGKRAAAADALPASAAPTVARKRRRMVRRAATAKAAPTVAFRNEAGQTWGGRGKRPQWLRDALANGRTLEEFRVKPDA